jgi:hypothetical protein
MPASKARSPLDADYTAHRDLERRRRDTQEWLRQREAATASRVGGTPNLKPR